MSGYCAIGRLNIATAPPSVMTIDITDAKIGRSMQKWERFMSLARSLRGQGTGRPALHTVCFARWRIGCGTRRGGGDDLQRHIGGHADRTVDNDALTRLQSLRDEPVVAVPLTHFDHTLMRFRAVVDNPPEVALRALQSRALRHEDRGTAGREEPLRVGCRQQLESASACGRSG